MKLRHPVVQRTIGFLGAVALKRLRQTIDWRAIYTDPRCDTMHPQFAGRYIFACWHEVLLMPIVLRGHSSMLALASENQDGELIARAMKHLNWSMARGSSSRGGVTAMLKLLRDDRRHPNLTPDGPRGPRRKMQMGPFFLAKQLGLPIQLVGYGFDRPWRARSWDRFCVPRPYSRGRAVFGPLIRVPSNADRDLLEALRDLGEKVLTFLTDDAENWAESDRRRPGELPMLPQQCSEAMRSAKIECHVHLPKDLTMAYTQLQSASTFEGSRLESSNLERGEVIASPRIGRLAVTAA